jgi:hypothetical protein
MTGFMNDNCFNFWIQPARLVLHRAVLIWPQFECQDSGVHVQDLEGF